MKRLHIVGCPRSGTTLLPELLSTCFDNAGSCAHEMSIFHAPDAQGDLFISKQPNDIRQLHYIFPRDDGLLVIYLGREHLPRVAEQYRRHPDLAQDLIRLGYQADQEWLELLEGVDSIIYPCRYPERRQYLKEWEKALRIYLKSRRYLKRQAC